MKIIHAAGGRLRIAVALATAALAILAGQGASARTVTPAAAAAKTGSASGSKPSIVLVHGAWADSSSWDAVVARLQRDG
jgi:pimeloyl-ACP methyl ester carboxylesterase